MANEPPTPKTHFAISPARPKGTIADYDAGNLPAPNKNGEGEVPRAPTVAVGKRGSRVKRRQPNPPKADTIHNDMRELEPDTSDIPEQDEEFFRGATLKVPPAQNHPTPYERVLADLLFKREQIETAIKALKELYE